MEDEVPPQAIKFFIVLGSITMLIGLMENITVLVVLCYYKRKNRNNFDRLVMNLTITDIGMIYAFHTVLLRLGECNPYGKASYIIYPITDTFVTNSVLSLVAITWNRYSTIVHPLDHGWSYKKTVMVIVSLWIFSFILNFACYLPFARVDSTTNTFEFDYGNNTNLRVMLTLGLVVNFIVPLVYMLFAFARIRAVLTKKIPDNNAGATQASVLRRAKAVRMMCTVVVVDMILMLPAQANLCIMIIKGNPGLSKFSGVIMLMVAPYLLLLNSVLNPIILSLMNSQYKSGFLHLKKVTCGCWNPVRRKNQSVGYKNGQARDAVDPANHSVFLRHSSSA